MRQWRDEDPRRAVVVVNTMYQWCPWADVLYAMDRPWWDLHGADVAVVFQGVCWSGVSLANGAHTANALMITAGNSGAGAIALAASVMRPSERIILMGYDAGYGNDGRRHCHGDHPSPLGNAGSVNDWPSQFRKLAKSINVDVVNCSPVTALRCFRRAPLEEALNEKRQSTAA